MFKITSYLVLLILILTACQNGKHQYPDAIRKKVFISVIPSGHYLDSIQKVTPEYDWMTIVDDVEYYKNLTREYLLEQGFEELHLETGQSVTFLLGSGEIQVIDESKIYDEWGTFIFNGKDSVYLYNGDAPEMALERE